jgi:site-specific DNA-methyltransferase (adenine-specific)/modification methylase
MEGRNFVGIEKNADTELFKGEKIDYIKKTKERLKTAWQHLDAEKREFLRKHNLIKTF